jgi:hypothetical protein
MLKSKIKNIILGNHFLGIEIFSENNSEKANCIIVEKKNDSLSISDTLMFDDINDIPLNNYTDLPAIITIYTDKVLIKETELNERNDLLLVKKTFANLNLEDFYFDVWRLEDKSIISIARRNYIDEMIKLFQESNKLKIVSFAIGVSNIKNIISFFSDENISLNSKKINIRNNSIGITEIKDSKIYSINGINIKSDHLISFSSIINFISKNKNGSIDELNTYLNNTFFQNTFFKKYLKFFLFFILGALVINFLFFNHYYNKFHEISILNTTEIENKEKIENLKRIIINKEKSVNELSISNTQRISAILNEISKSVPNTIILNELNFQPILKKGNTEILTKYSEKNILVSGITNSSIYFTSWIESLSTSKTIKDVVILKFEKEDNTTVFKINIHIK